VGQPATAEMAMLFIPGRWRRPLNGKNERKGKIKPSGEKKKEHKKSCGRIKERSLSFSSIKKEKGIEAARSICNSSLTKRKR